MKIQFKNEKEKIALFHILSDWFNNNGDNDVLGCEPACRNPESPSCEHCINDTIEYCLDNNIFHFWMFGGEDWICTLSVKGENK